MTYNNTGSCCWWHCLLF